MKRFICLISFILLIFLIFLAGYFSDRKISFRRIPIPDTVSPSMQKFLSISLAPLGMAVTPADTKQWHLLVQQSAVLAEMKVENLRKEFSMTIKNTQLNGVNTYTVTPNIVPAKNKNKIIINTHGGGYVILPGKSGLIEAILMAHYAKIPVIAIDYRMPPDFPFPAALDDTVAVYQEVIKTYHPHNVGFFGTSAGGGLTAAVMLKLKELQIELPAVLGLITPWSDLTKTGDTYFTNEGIDNILPHYKGVMEAAAKLYSGSYDIKNPLISPVYGDFKGFPPTILISGTRDLLLSCTVRIHRKLREQGTETQLYVFEAMPHAFLVINPQAPESIEAWKELADFFQKRLEQ